MLMRLGSIALVAGLAACSGGGDSGGNAGFTAEFSGNYGLARIDVTTVYNAGYTGACQTIAIIDTGIDVDHIDLDANIHSKSIDIVANNAVTVNDALGHGTAVAGGTTGRTCA